MILYKYHLFDSLSRTNHELNELGWADRPNSKGCTVPNPTMAIFNNGSRDKGKRSPSLSVWLGEEWVV